MAGSSTDEEAGMIKPFALRLFLFVFKIVGWLFIPLFFLLSFFFFPLSLSFKFTISFPLLIGLLKLKFWFQLWLVHWVVCTSFYCSNNYFEFL